MLDRTGPRLGLAVVTAVVVHLLGADAKAWTLSEHSHASMEGLAWLKARAPVEHATLQKAWAIILRDAQRAGRLLPAVDARSLTVLPASRSGSQKGLSAGEVKLTFSDMPSLAADHSCSPRDLSDTVANASWVNDVIIDARASYSILHEDSITDDLRNEYLRDLNLDLADHDPKYLIRASSNIPHFQPDRALHETDVRRFLGRALSSSLGAVDGNSAPNSNATAMYTVYHVAALRMARDLRAGSGGTVARMAPDRLWSVFLTEAFALHFLEDAFAAGHFMGAFVDRSRRVGTHDYYCIQGVEAWTWTGTPYVAHGDAALRQEDLDQLKAAVGTSLQQLAEALSAARPGDTPALSEDDLSLLDDRAVAPGLGKSEVDACTIQSTPPHLEALAKAAFLEDVVAMEPMPAAVVPRGPALRSEYGGFFALGTTVMAGFGNDPQRVPGREAPGYIQVTGSMGAGLAVDGLLANYRDSLIYGQGVVGVEGRADGKWLLLVGGRVRVPWGWFPLDPLVWIWPVIFNGSDPWAYKWSATASKRWTGYAGGGHNRVQISLGREATFLAGFRPTGTALEFDRYEVQLPVLSALLGHSFNGRLANDWLNMDIGARIAGGNGASLQPGVFFSATNRSRFYW